MKPIKTLARALTIFAAVAVLPGAAQAGPNEPAEKPIKTFISAIRYGKDDMAKKLIDGEAQGRSLLGEQWDKATPEQRSEFVSLFQVVFSETAFPKLRDNFQKIETIVYEPAVYERDRANIGSTLVILHPMKKQEIKVRYELAKNKSGYKLVDVTFQGDKSMLTNIRDDQILPLITEGGWTKLLDAMRARAKELGNGK